MRVPGAQVLDRIVAADSLSAANFSSRCIATFERLLPGRDLGLELVLVFVESGPASDRASAQHSGSVSPCPTSVKTITPKVMNRISVAMRERRAVRERQRDRERGGERHHAAHAGDSRGRTRPCQRGDGSRCAQRGNHPARDIGRRKHPDEARGDDDRRSTSAVATSSSRIGKLCRALRSARRACKPVSRNTKPSIR